METKLNTKILIIDWTFQKNSMQRNIANKRIEKNCLTLRAKTGVQ